MSSLRQNFVAVFAVCVSSLCCSEDKSKLDNVLGNLPKLSVSAAPVLTIVDDDTPDRQFTRISARRLPNDEIVIADQSPARIVVFARDGRVKKEVAHRGEGPDEIPGTFSFETAGDTLFATPFSPVTAGSVRVFNLMDGSLAQIAPVAANHPGRMTFRMRLDRTRWVVSKGSPGRAIYSVPPVGTFMTDSITLGILNLGPRADSNTVEWLPPIVQSWMLVVPLIGATGANGAPTAMPTSFPFKGATVYLVSDGQLWFINTENGELLALNQAGKQAVHVTLLMQRQQFDNKQIDVARTAALANAKSPMQKSMVMGRFDEKARPAKMPLFSEAFPGADGEIWLKVFSISENEEQQFVVVSRDGRMKAAVALPAKLQVQQVGRDFLLAVKSDEVGVQSVVEFAIGR